MSSTNDLISQARTLLARLDAGEEVSADEVAAWGDTLEAKLNALRWVRKMAEGEREVLDAEIDALLKKVSAKSELVLNVTEKARQLMVAHADLTGSMKVTTPTFTARLVANPPSVQGPADPEAWPEAYRKTQTKVVADRKAAREALLRGESIEGVTLVPGDFRLELK